MGRFTTPFRAGAVALGLATAALGPSSITVADCPA